MPIKYLIQTFIIQLYKINRPFAIVKMTGKKLNAIIPVMEKMILIAGKDYPDGRELSSAAELHGYDCLITTNSRAQNVQTDDGSKVAVWNRSSPLSCRSLVLSAMNITGRIDEAVLVFDEPYYAPSFGTPNAQETNRAFDELILGYQYLTSELLLRFSQKKLAGLESNPGKLVFLYKSNVTDAQTILNPSSKNASNTPSKSLVAAAGAAFKAFAENMAATLALSDDVIPVLVEADPNNETARKDSALMGWLCTYLAQIDSLKKDLSPKQKVSWVKAGAKSPGGFSLFK
ncbi:MAG TPA: hypothetical protein DCF70_02620 [Treponema sp.]|nr:hypothetical protein [Treponema sp.]